MYQKTIKQFILLMDKYQLSSSQRRMVYQDQAIHPSEGCILQEGDEIQMFMWIKIHCDHS